MTYFIVLFCVHVSTAPHSSRRQGCFSGISGRSVLWKTGEAEANSSLGFLRNGIWKTERMEKRDLKKCYKQEENFLSNKQWNDFPELLWRERPVSAGWTQGVATSWGIPYTAWGMGIQHYKTFFWPIKVVERPQVWKGHVMTENRCLSTNLWDRQLTTQKPDSL